MVLEILDELNKDLIKKRHTNLRGIGAFSFVVNFYINYTKFNFNN
ncbi:hypothetical protein CLK_0006 [Clostridium botulinum A3 str. Loch Maree]|nr:hypothetical protein CLK_0006 [Clostridium botulinum A3 str. Loch Maree]